MRTWTRRRSGLLEQFDPPELTIAAALERGDWRRRASGLLEPAPLRYLTTDPGPLYELYPGPRGAWLVRVTEPTDWDRWAFA